MCLTLAGGAGFRGVGVSCKSVQLFVATQPYGPLEDSMVSAPARHWPPRPPWLGPRTARHQDFNPKPVSFGREEGRAALEPDWELTTG